MNPTQYDLDKLVYGLQKDYLAVQHWDRIDEPWRAVTVMRIEVGEPANPSFRKGSQEAELINLLHYWRNSITQFSQQMDHHGRLKCLVELVITNNNIFQQASFNAQAMTKAMQALATNYPLFEKTTAMPVPEEESTELIIGYRDFDFSTDNFLLQSRNGTYWEPRQRLAAYCKGNPFAAHDAPSQNCNCGIYAFDTPTHSDLDRAKNIWGEVYLWGEVLVCESGYRAEFAYLKTLFVRDLGTRSVKRVAKHLEDEYGVPVFLVKAREGLTTGQVIDKMLQTLLLEK